MNALVGEEVGRKPQKTVGWSVKANMVIDFCRLSESTHDTRKNDEYINGKQSPSGKCSNSIWVIGLCVYGGINRDSADISGYTRCGP